MRAVAGNGATDVGDHESIRRVLSYTLYLSIWIWPHSLYITFFFIADIFSSASGLNHTRRTPAPEKHYTFLGSTYFQKYPIHRTYSVHHTGYFRYGIESYILGSSSCFLCNMNYFENNLMYNLTVFLRIESQLTSQCVRPAFVTACEAIV